PETMASEIETRAMQRAILLAAFGLGSTSPNPPVGRVVLDRDGHVVGEGYHQRKGEAHAEVHALAAAGGHARGSTAVVTLEPCNHHGRTPPCRQALLDAGIARTVIALIDPTSREEGGAARLRAAGVDVEVGVLAEAARQVMRPWLHGLSHRRPHVTWLYEVGPHGHISSPDEALVRRHRIRVDAVVDVHGRVSEGLPDAHGPAAFSLSTTAMDREPVEVLKALYAGGVRSLLAACHPDLARRLLAAGLVDQVTFYATPAPPSAPGTRTLVPAGFGIEAIDAAGEWIQVTATPQH
ncbi:bifunctional diaminohydroxyphosphoribosylaminopyrimidine deaminase/5-amino-6-(5-phosphoribosylamino)uracil reductase RibD, partial [Actinosynnema sp. NPDC059797]